MNEVRRIESEVGPPSGGLLYALWSLAKPATFEAVTPAQRKVPFAERRGRGIRPRADVWLPEGPGPHPSVVVVHGGGFVIGSRKMKPVRLLASTLVRQGWAVASCDYRMIFRGGRLDESLEDVTAALRWWAGQAGELGLDPRRIAMAGYSAGAALMLLSAAQADVPLSHLVSIYGVYDFAFLSGRAAGLMRRLLLQSRDPEIWRERSPLAQATNPAKLLVAHGTGDRMVPVDHAHRLHARRSELGLPSELVLYDGMPHGFANHSDLPATDRLMDDVVAFLGE